MRLTNAIRLFPVCIAAVLLESDCGFAQAATEAAMSIENEYAKYGVGADGVNARFVEDRKSVV